MRPDALDFLVTADTHIEVEDFASAKVVQIGPVRLTFRDVEVAAQVELAVTQARALLEPVNEPTAADRSAA